MKVDSRHVFVVETKGLEDLDVPLKMERLKQWCKDVNKQQPEMVYDFVYVDQESFERYKPQSFEGLKKNFREYKDT